MQDKTALRLTPTSFIVLGFLELAGEMTPYDLKQTVTLSVGNFWSFPHSQLYAEPDRLARAGYVEVEQEARGRRRKRYSLTARGRGALEEWRSSGVDEQMELRDPALLKLFFGADPKTLAAAQVELYEERLREYESLRERAREGFGSGPALTLEAGIGHTRESIRFWKRLAGGSG